MQINNTDAQALLKLHSSVMRSLVELTDNLLALSKKDPDNRDLQIAFTSAYALLTLSSKEMADIFPLCRWQ
jgi:hypothetical protein